MRSALIVIDVQRGFDDPMWGPRNSPHCERHIGRLIDGWREAGQPIVLVRHDSTSPTSPLRPGQPGNGFKPVADIEADLLVVKSVNSAFYGAPDLHAWLRSQGIDSVTICGITTNHCCETTARMAGNLGFDTVFVTEATHTFDRMSPDGTRVTADDLARATEANLHGEFATVCGVDAALARLR